MRLLFYFVASLAAGVFQVDAHMNCEALSLEKRIIRVRSVVSLLGAGHTRFMLKQLDGFPQRYITKTAAEALGVFIAESIGIPCNHVQIIPAQESCQHKYFAQQPATLHTYIEGKTLAKLKIFDAIDIRLKQRYVENRVKTGLTETTIRGMAMHPDLPPIAALDTFIGNYDRHASNLIYNKHDDHFYAIDFTVTFYVNLADIAIENLQEMIEAGVAFNDREMQGLRSYRDTLRKILAMHTPASLRAQFEKFLEQTGMSIVLPSLAHRKKKALYRTIKQCKELINVNYHASQKLLILLNKICS